MSMNEVVKKLSQAIDKQADKAKTTAYDTPATVRRIEGDTAWVHIPGGVDETPVKLTISAKEGDQVQVRVSGGSAFMVGNGTNPPTDDARANEAYAVAGDAIDSATMARSAAQIAEASAQSAKAAAESAEADAVIAKATTDEINNYADSVSKTVTQVLADGETAGAAAQAATEAADSALYGLSTVEDVVGVLNWITAHGTMTLTSDVTVNPAHVYFVVDPTGDYVVGGTHYSIVSEPKDAELSTYYELTVDESVQNYVATHIVVDSEGLWIVPDSGGNKVLIATGAGSTYTTAGTYIIGKVDGVDTVLAGFTADGAQIGQSGGAGRMTVGNDSIIGYNSDSVPYFAIDMDGGATESPYSDYTMKAQSGPTVNITTTDTTMLSTEKVYDIFDVSTGTFKIENTRLQLYVPGNRKITSVFSPTNVKSYEILDADVEGSHYGVIVYGKTSNFTVGTNKTFLVEFYCKAITSNSTEQNLRVQFRAVYDAATNSITYSYSAKTYTETISNVSVFFSCYTKCFIPTKAPALIFGSNDSETPGDYSSSFGEQLYTSGSHQTSLGKYNIEDTNSDYAAIIGNGTADNARSNALTVDWSGNVMAQGMAGVIQMFAGTTAPTGWLICDGSAVSRTTYATLFAVIGTTYGAGNGSTTFNLPDLRGRVAVGAGTGTAADATYHALGSEGGEETHTLTTSEIPGHTHGPGTLNITASGSHAHKLYYQQDTGSGTARNRVTPNGTTGTAGTNNATQTATHTHSSSSFAGDTAENTGGGGAHNNMQPYLSINYIIATGKTA